MSFRFRLEPLLRLRTSDRDQRQAELVQTYQTERSLRQRKDVMKCKLDELKRLSRQASQPGLIHVDQLLGVHRYQLVIQSESNVLDQRSRLVAAEIRTRRERLVEADRQVQQLEKLKERTYRRHLHDQQRRETNRLDEIGQRACLVGRPSDE